MILINFFGGECDFGSNPVMLRGYFLPCVPVVPGIWTTVKAMEARQMP